MIREMAEWVTDLRIRSIPCKTAFVAERLSAHEDGQHVDEGHKESCQNPGMQHFTGNRRIILHTHLPDHLNNYDAESETCNAIQVYGHKYRDKKLYRQTKVSISRFSYEQAIFRG